MKWKATAFNDKGDTWAFHFWNENWNGVDEAAKERLNTIVENDAFHQRNGPWQHKDVDVA